jgi:O-antigen/teichoic acid export membrane protein
MRSSFRPALVLMAGRSLGFLVTFFIPVVLSRMFTRPEFGTYKQAFLVYGTLYGIAQLGMAESLFYFLPSKPTQAGRLVANAIAMLGFSGAACVVVLVLGGPALSGYMNNPVLAHCMLPLGLYLVLTMASVVLEIVMIARKRHRTAAASYAASECFRAAFFLVPVLVFGHVAALLYGAVAFAVLRLAATLWYLRKVYADALRANGGLWREQLRYALPFALSVLVEMIHTNLHQYVVSFRFDAATFAVYSVGILQIPLVDFLATPASSVMMVAMSDNLRDGRTALVTEIWHDTTRKLALVFFPLVALLVVAAPDIIRLLFTEKYAASIPLFAIWSTTVLLAAFQTDGVLRVYAATRTLLTLNVFRLAAVGTLIVILIPPLGLQGAVLATVVAAFVARGAGLVLVGRLIKTGAAGLLPWRSLAGIFAAAIAASAPAFAVRGWALLPLLPRLALTGAVFAACYIGLLFRTGILRPEERLALTSWTGAVGPSMKAEQTS